ncbi:MAG: hypothetical protein M3443_09610, partial [Actinomycetota bacterium]|nr:hypothetical protein [Actinomycetota bacterium]
MSFSTLAEHVVNVLARLMTGRVHRSSTSDMLVDAVVSRLRRVGALGAFDTFARDALSPHRRGALLEVLNDQFRRDPLFRDTITSLVAAVESPMTPLEPTEPPIQTESAKPDTDD